MPKRDKEDRQDQDRQDQDKKDQQGPLEKRQAKLSIRTQITDQEEETIEGLSLSEASLEREGKEGVVSLSYAEPVENQMEDTQSTLILEKDRILLKREGQVSMTMVFEKGKNTSCSYEVEGLCLDLALFTQSWQVDYEDGWPVQIRLAYRLLTGPETQSRHQMTLDLEYRVKKPARQ